MYLLICFILQFLVSSNHATIKHAVHVTVTNIDFNEKDSNFDVAVKFFPDDFQGVIYHKYAKVVETTKPSEIKKNEALISKYIEEHLKIDFKIKNQTKLIFEKSESLNGALWLYYKTKVPKHFKNIVIVNSLMNDYYYDQSNLLFFNYKGKQEAIQFDYNLTEKKITL